MCWSISSYIPIYCHIPLHTELTYLAVGTWTNSSFQERETGVKFGVGVELFVYQGWLNSFRSQDKLWGELDKLTPKARALVLAGNLHARFSIEVLRHVAQQPLAVGAMENPAGSVIWRLPELVALERQWPQKFFRCTCDYCQYGKPWRKRTTVLWVGVDTSLVPQRLCTPRRRGRCSRSGRPHLTLGQGRCHPRSGKPLTRLAEPYPKPLAKKFADCLARCVL